jgi:RNA polymerase sigma factor (sigma-70 family)
MMRIRFIIIFLNGIQKYSEQDLVLLLKQSDKHAFAYLYDNYSGALHTVLLQIIPDRMLCSDTLQEVFVKIWRQIGQYDTEKGRLFTWMYNIARNAAIDVIRSKSWRNAGNTIEFDSASQVASYTTTPSTDAVGIMRLVATLKPDQRAVVELSYAQGYTQEEIGKMLNIPIGTVKTRMRAALLALRNKFNEE